MKLHLVSLPHTETTSEYLTCAYTQKVVKFARMMHPRGHDIILYAGELNEAPVLEHVPLLSRDERQRLFGPYDPAVPPGWPADPLWTLFNARAVEAIRERAEPEDLVLVTGGYSQRYLADELELLCVEPFVGYEGVYCNHAAFESYCWQHHVYAKRGHDGRFFDAVIPNYFDPAEFVHHEPWRASTDPYLLYLGRLIGRKGVGTALDIAKAAGMQLVVAGPGATHVSEGLIVSDELRLEGDVHYAGSVGVEDRSRLLHGAEALLVPTTYVEPFGGVAVEAMMCGTPVVATDWGAFTETVPRDWRFRTLEQALDALDNIAGTDRQQLRQETTDEYSLDAIAPDFEAWFDSLSTLWHEGWYSLRNREVLT